jgi:hypothetical protein
LSSLFALSFQVFHCPIDGGDQFIVPLAFGPALFRSQHVGELGQQVGFFLPNEHGVNFSSVSLSIRDSPDESQTGINIRVFPALLQDRREVLTATSTSGNPNVWSRV